MLVHGAGAKRGAAQRARQRSMSQGDSTTELQALELLELALGQASDSRARFIETAPGFSQAARARARALLAGGRGSAYLQTDGVGAFTLALADAPRNIGAYRIIKEIGRGGMGAVYEAERDQGDFDRKVAIKIIGASRVSDTLIDRFTQERQILAQLTHPYIARLYDGGETDDGLPYLVMELVEGVPLKTWLEDSPEETACFAVLRKILSAVEYAHSTLVIHRDLTPSNVIVTQGAGVKIIDFGISSFSSAQGGPVLSGQTATPGFAPPEARDSTAQSTTIDIYALGKLIRLMFQRFGSPELMAIADKACASDPDSRYGTVLQLAQDVERYRTGYAVEAYGQQRVYKAKKYMRRNWLALTIVGGILAGLVIAGSMIAQAYQQEQTALKLAANRFDAVRDLARFQLFEVYDALDDIPNTIAARQLIARSSITYLNDLAITPDAPRDLRLEVGTGWLRLSQVTGGASGDHIGLPEDAMPFGERALEVLEALLQDYPNDIEIRITLGSALGSLAFDSLYMDGDSEAGYARAQRALELLSDLPPDTLPIAAATAKAYRALGDAHGWRNALPQAGEAYAQGLEFVRALPPALQNSLTMVTMTSPLMRQLAEVHRYTGKPDKALNQMGETIAFIDAAIARSTQADAWQVKRNLAVALWNAADMNRALSRWDEGLPYALRAKGIIDAGIALNPEDIGWRELRPQTLSVLAQLHSAKGAHDLALAAADSAIADLRGIRQRSGENAGADLSLAVGWKDVAPVFRRAGQADIACAGLAEALSIMKAYDAAGALSDYDRGNNLAPMKAAYQQCEAPKAP